MSEQDSKSWSNAQSYGMAVICLLLGVAAGYLIRGSQSTAPLNSPNAAGPADASAEPTQRMPTLEQMKAMADRKVDPLLKQLKSDPKNKDLLIQIASYYKSAHQFKDAAAYLSRAAELDPKNTAIRTERATCLYFDGDIDGALTALQESLHQSPTDANALFNLGLIRWKGKKDAAGAIAAWKELLKTNPNLDKKPIVEQMIAEAQGKSS